jgi:hypothetical protein
MQLTMTPWQTDSKSPMVTKSAMFSSVSSTARPTLSYWKSSANGYGDKVGMVVAIDMADETLRGIAVSPPIRRPPASAQRAKDDPSFRGAVCRQKPIKRFIRRHHRWRSDQRPERRHDHLAGRLHWGQQSHRHLQTTSSRSWKNKSTGMGK